MADWPLSGMNNFGYPEFTYRIQHEGPETLTTRFDDGSVLSRQKNSVIVRRFFENWHVNRTDAAAMIEFYKLKGLNTTFDKLGLDPTSLTNFTTDVVAVRFAKEPEIEQVGPLWYSARFEFIEIAI